MLVLENNPVEWDEINDKIITPYSEVLKTRKYLFWNLMEIVERLDGFKFEQFLRRLDDNGFESTDNEKFVQYLRIENDEVETWVAEYFRLNFAHYSLPLQNLANAVDYIMSNDKTDQYLTHQMDFTYNNTHDTIRQFHFANVRLFLYLGHKKANYAKLAHLLKNHSWMVILFKKMVNKDLDQYIIDISEHIGQGGSPQDNAQKILEFINKKHEDLEPSKEIDFNDLADNYDFLDEEFDDIQGEGLEDEIENSLDLEQDEVLSNLDSYIKDEFMEIKLP